jgi:hypothetical protein
MEKITYFTTEDGNNCLSLQTKANDITPEKYISSKNHSSHRNTAQKALYFKNSRSQRNIG